MHWRDATIHVIDFEGSLHSGIVEFGVVSLHGGRIVRAQTRLCAPSGRMREADIDVHRLRPAQLSGLPTFAAEWETFCQLRASGPLAAHFAGAENHLLKSVWPYPPASPDFLVPGRNVSDWGPWIDSGRLYTKIFPDLASGGLRELVENFGYQPELDRLAEEYCPSPRCAYHAALYDALAASLLLLKLGERPEFATLTVGALVRMSQGSRARERVAQGDLFE